MLARKLSFLLAGTLATLLLIAAFYVCTRRPGLLGRGIARLAAGSGPGSYEEEHCRRLEKGEEVTVFFSDSKHEAAGRWTYDECMAFKTVKDLVEAFASHILATDFVPVTTQNTGEKFIFAFADPYCGINAMELYCYRKTDRGLFLCALAFLTNLDPMKLTIVNRGEVIEVVNGGTVIMTLDTSKVG